MSILDQVTETNHAFRAALEAALGAAPDHIEADGQIHRFKTEQDKRGERSGWYVLYLDRVPAGAFGNWRSGLNERWSKVDQSRLTVSQLTELRRHIRKQRAQAALERQEAQGDAAEKVRKLWEWAKPANPMHPYLQAKQMPPLQLRQHGDALLVPLTDGHRMVNLQRIFPDGSKRFYPGGRVSGCWSPIEGEKGPLYICEGWSTGATINKLTGHLVVCAMNAGNLTHVAKAMRERDPDRYLVIAGDNDRFTDGNPGKAAAIDAARAVGGEWKIPDFPEGEQGTDYNDRYLLELEGKL
ncbi:toprim domain-containing protein [Alcanivorax sp.]|uniref:toprim domain-containing protein n=1 Tax=Alcanivorax sp. TaxID=1872427 RepID=UPI0025C2B7B4|nr:toprim domain-containing protein [Alcanivorax sp.]